MKTRGEEICGTSIVSNHLHRNLARERGSPYLVGRVTDAHVKRLNLIIGDLDKIPHDNLQLPLQRRPLHLAAQLRRHPRVQLHRNHAPRLLQYPRRQHTGTGADLQDGLDGLDVRLVDDGVRDGRVLEDMLADLGVELEDGRLAGGALVGRAALRAVALLALGLGHGVSRVSGVAGRVVG